MPPRSTRPLETSLSFVFLAPMPVPFTLAHIDGPQPPTPQRRHSKGEAGPTVLDNGTRLPLVSSAKPQWPRGPTNFSLQGEQPRLNRLRRFGLFSV